ncbi:MAG: hypothetical protein NC254_14605, partial [bacterium]|nr:hypothetical protein [bacterium]
LDGLQMEEEPQPQEETAGEDFLSLDSLQTEEEPAPMEDVPAGEDFLSLDGLQTEEEPQPLEETQEEEDFLSLDSLQGEENMDFGSTAEDDAAIQKEIDELLGLTDGPEEESAVNDGAAGESIPESVNGVEDTPHKKEKKKKKKLFGNRKKGTAESAPGDAEESASADMGSIGQINESDHISMDMSDDEMMADALQDSGQGAEAPADGKQKKTKAKKEKTKEKREKTKKQKTADSENGQKEPGFFARMLNGLFEEVDEEEEQPQELEVSDENREIMAMMENEKIDNKKPDSKKAKKAKKGKKGKADAKQEEDADGDEEAPVDEKKAQKEKKKKEKKEKKEQKRKEKQEKEQEEKAAAKKLPKGKVFSIFAFCLTILVVVVILCIVLPQQRDLKTAREAYYDHDYLTVYQNMDGKNLSDSDYILYMRSRMVLNMQGKLDNYLVYLGMDKEMAALNELMLAVHYYQTNRAAAEGYGALEEMNTVYEQVLSVLSQQYQLSEADAVEIFALDDLSYNERLYYLVHGTEFVAPGVPQSGIGDDWNGSTGNDSESGILDDMLPEESEMITDDQPQDAVNGVPENGAGTEGAGTPTDWQVNIGDGTMSTDNGAGEFGTDLSDGQYAGTDDGNQSGGVSGEAVPDGSGGDSASDDGGNLASDTGSEGQTQNTPGESLSQGNGDVLYSGEVQNGNAVLQ